MKPTGRNKRLWLLRQGFTQLGPSIFCGDKDSMGWLIIGEDEINFIYKYRLTNIESFLHASNLEINNKEKERNCIYDNCFIGFNEKRNKYYASIWNMYHLSSGIKSKYMIDGEIREVQNLQTAKDELLKTMKELLGL